MVIMKPGKVKVFYTHHVHTGDYGIEGKTEWETWDFTSIDHSDNYVTILNGDKLVALLSNDVFEKLIVIEQPE